MTNDQIVDLRTRLLRRAGELEAEISSCEKERAGDIADITGSPLLCDTCPDADRTAKLLRESAGVINNLAEAK